MQATQQSQTEAIMQQPKSKTKLTRTQILQRIIIGLWVLAGLSIFTIMICTFDDQRYANSIWYKLLVLLPLAVIGVLSTIQWRRKKISDETTLLTWSILGVVYLVAFWFTDFASWDWNIYLSRWCYDYQTMSWTEALRQITNVSNYVPLYNYFLIAFTRCFDLQGCLYAIKYLTFIFSIAMAIVMELIICQVRHTKFSYLHLALFLLLPPVLLEFSAWGQCDVIYTTFALLAFYCALKHRSVWCFITLGLAFAIKLQFLFIVPIIFVMLIIRDQEGKKYIKWQWLWLAPLMYVFNLIPLIFGAKFIDIIMIYVGQIGEYKVFSSNCLNFPILLDWLCKLIAWIRHTETGWVHPNFFNIMTINLAIIGIMLTIALLIIVLRTNRRKNLTELDLIHYALCFAMVMVYFMPKMHERFYFIAFALSIIWICVQPDKWHTLISTMITVSLTCCFFFYLFSGAVDIHTNIFFMILFVAAYVIGWILNTLALIFLMHPVVKNEIAQRKIDEKKQVR